MHPLLCANGCLTLVKYNYKAFNNNDFLMRKSVLILKYLLIRVIIHFILIKITIECTFLYLIKIKDNPFTTCSTKRVLTCYVELNNMVTPG